VDQAAARADKLVEEVPGNVWRKTMGRSLGVAAVNEGRKARSDAAVGACLAPVSPSAGVVLPALPSLALVLSPDVPGPAARAPAALVPSAAAAAAVVVVVAAAAVAAAAAAAGAIPSSVVLA
jgi:hypothetical protein